MQSFACHRAASVIGLAGCLPDELTAKQIARLYMPECPDKPKQRLRTEIFRFITAAIEAGVLKARAVEIPALLERVATWPMVDRYGRHSYSRISERKRADTDKAPPALQNNYARRGREAIIETRPDTLSVTLISAAAFYVWDGKPHIPEGEAGELIRAWLSLATGESAAASESVPAENAARVVALPPAEPREVRAMKRCALILLMRKTYPQADSWFAKTGPGTIREAAKLPQHGMWNASAAFSWAEMQTGKRARLDDWPDEASG